MIIVRAINAIWITPNALFIIHTQTRNLHNLIAEEMEAILFSNFICYTKKTWTKSRG